MFRLGRFGHATVVAAFTLAALDRSQAIIEFDLDGTVLMANANFLNLLGYTPAEIYGKHHRMFVEPTFAASPEYKRSWDDLCQGEYQAARFKRVGKGGKEAWLQASHDDRNRGGGATGRTDRQ